MSNKERRKAPVLRFKGFTDDWEQRKFNELGKLYYGKSAPKWSVVEKGGTPCIRYGELYTKYSSKIDNIYSHTSIDKSKLKFSTGNELLIPRVGEEPLDFAKHTSWLSIPNVAIGEMITVLKTKENPLFLANYLRAKYVFKFARLVEGGNVSNLYFERYEDTNILIPSKNEQQNISKLILKIDKLITLQQRKLKELKQIKGSLLTKILAGKNSNQPILRFRNFKNNWKQYRLKDLYTYSNGKAHEQSQQLNGKYELINLNSISIDGSLKSSGKYVNKSKDILKKNDLVMVLSDIAHGLLLGRVAVIPKDNKYVLNQRIALLRPQKNDENSNFMASLINNNQSYFHRMGSGTSQLNISKSAVTESKWFIPEPDEQLAIGNLLKEIDNYIFLQQDKINQLTALRKFLSQNLFI